MVRDVMRLLEHTTADPSRLRGLYMYVLQVRGYSIYMYHYHTVSGGTRTCSRTSWFSPNSHRTWVHPFFTASFAIRMVGP